MQNKRYKRFLRHAKFYIHTTKTYLQNLLLKIKNQKPHTLLTITTLIILFLAFLFYPITTISIKVYNQHLINNSTIKNITNTLQHKPFFRYSTKKLEQLIKNQSLQIKEVHIKKQTPGHILVTITEINYIAKLQQQNQSNPTSKQTENQSHQIYQPNQTYKLNQTQNTQQEQKPQQTLLVLENNKTIPVPNNLTKQQIQFIQSLPTIYILTQNQLFLNTTIDLITNYNQIILKSKFTKLQNKDLQIQKIYIIASLNTIPTLKVVTPKITILFSPTKSIKKQIIELKIILQEFQNKNIPYKIIDLRFDRPVIK